MSEKGAVLSLKQLAEIEWSSFRVTRAGKFAMSCPICMRVRPGTTFSSEFSELSIGHTSDCWLAAKIRAARGNHEKNENATDHLQRH